MSCAWPTSSCTFAVSASLRCSVGALRIHSRSGSTPISSELRVHLDELDELLPVLVGQPVRRLDLAAVLDVREELLCARVHSWPPYLPIVRLRIIDVREA